MAVGTKWTILALALALSAGCSDDSSSGGGDGDGDGQSDGTPDDGSGDGQISIDGDPADGGDGNDDEPILGAGTAGKACTDNAACAPSGTCATTLTAGAIGSIFQVNVAAEGGYCTAACQNDAQCGEGGVCFGEVPAVATTLVPDLETTDGECRASCTTNDDCRDGFECAVANLSAVPEMLRGVVMLETTCQPKPVVVELTDGAGKACANDGDCGPGQCLTTRPLQSPFPGGYCSATCTEDSQCGSEGVCVAGLYGTGGQCHEICETDADCARDADGYGCRAQGDKKACVPVPNPLPDGALGTACTDAGGECGSGTCATELAGPITGLMPPAVESAPGGYCTQACTDNVDCGVAGACIVQGGSILAPERLCFATCTTDTECREGYRCADRQDFLSGTSKICEPGERVAPTDPDAGT